MSNNLQHQYSNVLHHDAPQTKEQAEWIETLVRLPGIGLSLQISPSLLKQMEQNTKSKRKRPNHATGTSHSSPTLQARVDSIDSEKLKASILGAQMLQIGSWQVVARYEGDLVAKCYFAKKKLVWEILRNGLKEKIEIDWSNIIGIRAIMEQDKPGILELELQHPPKFYREIEPEPRKHTKWTDGSDFTDGQAYINRRHFIVFRPKLLDKHYQKLLKCDEHLFKLSQRPFPTFKLPYFPSALEINRFKAPSDLQFGGHQSFPKHQTLCDNNYHQKHQEMSSNFTATYSEETLVLAFGEEPLSSWMMSSNNPISSSVCLADHDQHHNLPTDFAAHQPSLSVVDYEHLDGTVMNNVHPLMFHMNNC